MEDSLVDKRVSEHGGKCVKYKSDEWKICETTSNINLVVLNNYYLSLDPKSELIYFGREF